MMLAIKGFQTGSGDVGIDLSGGNIGVPQEQLHGAKVGAVIEHMDVNNDMANQVLNNPRTLEGFMRLMVDLVYEGFERRRAG